MNKRKQRGQSFIEYGVLIASTSCMLYLASPTIGKVLDVAMKPATKMVNKLAVPKTNHD